MILAETIENWPEAAVAIVGIVVSGIVLGLVVYYGLKD